ncbi:MAG: HPr(Ser) kinase/phosphatase [Gammaproteobacteria bacterium]
MSAPLSCESLFARCGDRLQLTQVAGQRGNSLSLQDSLQARNSLVGFLNLIRPNTIQLIGTTEIEFLESLGKNSLQDTLEAMYEKQPRLIILTDDLPPTRALITLADQHDIPLWQTPQSGYNILQSLRHQLEPLQTPSTILHGVFMEVMGIGVLFSGSSGIGKSELALELVNRGHRLIADDAPEFFLAADGTILGRSPGLLRNFLEVRGLGILNIRAMFGDNAVMEEKPLQLILHLSPLDDDKARKIDRLAQQQSTRRIYDQDIPEVPLLVAVGRDLGVIVEAAVRNYVLRLNGYSAVQDFLEKQQQQMAQDKP